MTSEQYIYIYIRISNTKHIDLYIKHTYLYIRSLDQICGSYIEYRYSCKLHMISNWSFYTFISSTKQITTWNIHLYVYSNAIKLIKLGARRIDGRVVLWVSMYVDVVCNPFLQWDWHWCCFSVIQRGPAMLKFENLCFYLNKKLIFSVFRFDVTNWVLHILHTLNREKHHVAWHTSYVSCIS